MYATQKINKAREENSRISQRFRKEPWLRLNFEESMLKLKKAPSNRKEGTQFT